MVTLFLLMPFVALFMVINITLGCYVAIRLGYGPPNWQKALNLVVRLTTLQDWLNDGRDWLEAKAPWIVKYLDRLRLPKPLIFVDITAPEEEAAKEESVPGEEAAGATDGNASAEQADKPADGQVGISSPAEQTPSAPTSASASAPAGGAAATVPSSSAAPLDVAKPAAATTSQEPKTPP
jgi:hypothetical protein